MPRGNYKKKRFYAVARGRQTGVFTCWEDCRVHVEGFAGNAFQGFATMDEARKYLRFHGIAVERVSSENIRNHEHVSSSSLDVATTQPPQKRRCTTPTDAVNVTDSSSSLPPSRPPLPPRPPPSQSATTYSASTFTRSSSPSSATSAAAPDSESSPEVQFVGTKTTEQRIRERVAKAAAQGQLIEILSPSTPAVAQQSHGNATRTTPACNDLKPPPPVKSSASLFSPSVDHGQPATSWDQDRAATAATKTAAPQKQQKSPPQSKSNDRRIRITELLSIHLRQCIQQADHPNEVPAQLPSNDGPSSPTSSSAGAASKPKEETQNSNGTNRAHKIINQNHHRNMHGDVPTLNLHGKFFCQGVRVGWPYAAIMPPQRQMVNAVIMACQRQLHAVLESPTGTGKSAALLCAVLAWQRYHGRRNQTQRRTALPPPDASGDEDANEDDEGDTGTPRGNGTRSKSSFKNKRLPKIYYCSRTHSQGM
jgi:hypothetical protein